MVLSVSDSQRLYVILDRYIIFRKPGTKIGSYIQSIRVRDVLWVVLFHRGLLTARIYIQSLMITRSLLAMFLEGGGGRDHGGLARLAFGGWATTNSATSQDNITVIKPDRDN